MILLSVTAHQLSRGEKPSTVPATRVSFIHDIRLRCTISHTLACRKFQNQQGNLASVNA